MLLKNLRKFYHKGRFASGFLSAVIVMMPLLCCCLAQSAQEIDVLVSQAKVEPQEHSCHGPTPTEQQQTPINHSECDCPTSVGLTDKKFMLANIENIIDWRWQGFNQLRQPFYLVRTFFPMKVLDDFVFSDPPLYLQFFVLRL